MIEYVYLLQHSYQQQYYYSDRYYTETKNLGDYSSKEEAESAIEFYKTLQGFKDHPDGFHITEYKVDEHHCKDGIVIPEGAKNIKGYDMEDYEREDAENAHKYSLFGLQHYFEYEDKDGCCPEETRDLGYYSSWEKGMEAKAHYKAMKGFKDLPDDCFYLGGCVLNRKGWIEGFVTIEADEGEQAE